MSNANKEEREKLLQLMRDMLEQDKALRAQYQIGDKFRFIRDRLNALAARIEENLGSLATEEIKKTDKVLEDDVIIYVHLFNAHGLMFHTWQKMLIPSFFYEYSVNRPIYTDKAQVDAFIRSRPNAVQHGYITLAVKKTDILPAGEVDVGKDSIGNELVKVREGSLQFERVIAFTQNNQEYILNEEGELEKKI